MRSAMKQCALPNRRTLPMILCVGALLCAPLCFAAPGTQPATKPATGPSSKVSEAEQIEFLQKNVQAQMQELQERMYRLAEMVKATEPGDAAKLILALRRSREELILEEMSQILDRLGQKDFNKAGTETQEVIIKLEKLKELLLSTDLDLQLALERIKKLQGAIAKLDAAIKEEKRQAGHSGEMAKATTQPAKALDGAKQDQQQNRQATDAVAQAVKQI